MTSLRRFIHRALPSASSSPRTAVLAQPKHVTQRRDPEAIGKNSAREATANCSYFPRLVAVDKADSVYSARSAHEISSGSQSPARPVETPRSTVSSPKSDREKIFAVTRPHTSHTSGADSLSRKGMSSPRPPAAPIGFEKNAQQPIGIGSQRRRPKSANRAQTSPSQQSVQSVPSRSHTPRSSDRRSRISSPASLASSFKTSEFSVIRATSRDDCQLHASPQKNLPPGVNLGDQQNSSSCKKSSSAIQQFFRQHRPTLARLNRCHSRTTSLRREKWWSGRLLQLRMAERAASSSARSSARSASLTNLVVLPPPLAVAQEAHDGAIQDIAHRGREACAISLPERSLPIKWRTKSQVQDRCAWRGRIW